jgi:hypothetical protein
MYFPLITFSVARAGSRPSWREKRQVSVGTDDKVLAPRIVNYLESQQAEATPVSGTSRYGSERYGERCSGVLMFRKSIEDLVNKTIAGEGNNRVVIQGNLLRDLCRVFPVRGDYGMGDGDKSGHTPLRIFGAN